MAYRLGFAMSRAEARQLVRHAHFTVNGQKVNIPSYQVKPGDVIELKLGERTVRAEITSVTEHAQKADAAEMYRLLP